MINNKERIKRKNMLMIYIVNRVTVIMQIYLNKIICNKLLIICKELMEKLILL